MGGEDKREKEGGGSVTDSCQENESAVCQPTIHTHNRHAYKVRGPEGDHQASV